MLVSERLPSLHAYHSYEKKKRLLYSIYIYASFFMPKHIFFGDKKRVSNLIADSKQLPHYKITKFSIQEYVS